jgi:hypothetical protein
MVSFAEIHVLSLYPWSVRFPVSLLYVLLGLFDLLLIVRIVWNRHRLSYYFAFNVLVLVWDAFRLAFFLLSDQLEDVPLLFYIVYNIPLEVQFATFSLLVVFYASVVHKDAWNRLHPWFWAAYALMNALVSTFLLFYVVLVWTWGNISDVASANVFEEVRQVAFATCSTAITSLLLFYGFFLARIVAVDDQAQRLILLRRGSGRAWLRLHKLQLVLVNFVIWLAFASRAFYYILVSFDPSVGLLIDTGDLEQDLIGYSFLIFWEVVPTFIVLTLFVNIPSSRPAVDAEEVVPGLRPLLGSPEPALEAAPGPGAGGGDSDPLSDPPIASVFLGPSRGGELYDNEELLLLNNGRAEYVVDGGINIAPPMDAFRRGGALGTSVPFRSTHFAPFSTGGSAPPSLR